MRLVECEFGLAGGGLAFEFFTQPIVASVGHSYPSPNFKTDVIRFIYGGTKVRPIMSMSSA